MSFSEPQSTFAMKMDGCVSFASCSHTLCRMEVSVRQGSSSEEEE